MSCRKPEPEWNRGSLCSPRTICSPPSAFVVVDRILGFATCTIILPHVSRPLSFFRRKCGSLGCEIGRQRAGNGAVMIVHVANPSIRSTTTKLKVATNWYEAEHKEPLFPFGFGSPTRHTLLQPEHDNAQRTVSFDVKNVASVRALKSHRCMRYSRSCW